MPRLFLLLALGALAASGCTQAPPPVSLVADLVPTDALAALLPDAVEDFRATGDEVYRGYFADSTGALALVTVARTYMHGAVMMTMHVSSMDRPDRYRALVEASGARALPDSTVRASPALAAAAAAGWRAYEVRFGQLLVHDAGRAVEIKMMLSDAPAAALAAVDLARLNALPEERVAVDDAFVRPGPEAPEAGTTPAREPRAVLG